MNRWGNKDKDPNNYIFPVLQTGLSPQQQYETRQLLIAIINNWMRRISEKENIEREDDDYSRPTFIFYHNETVGSKY
jgi:hypothetical protein